MMGEMRQLQSEQDQGVGAAPWRQRVGHWPRVRLVDVDVLVGYVGDAAVAVL